MEKNLSDKAGSLMKETGDYLVIISALNANCCVEETHSSVVFTEGKSLEDAVSIALSLKHALPPSSRVYVVYRDSFPVYTTSYTCVFDF